MFEKEIVISEKLIGYHGSGIRYEQRVEKESNSTEISKVISVSGKHSSKIKGLQPKLKFRLEFFWDVLIAEG